MPKANVVRQEQLISQTRIQQRQRKPDTLFVGWMLPPCFSPVELSTERIEAQPDASSGEIPMEAKVIAKANIEVAYCNAS